MAVEQAYIDFFSKSERSEIMVETIEIYHPNFSQTYYLQYVSRNPITVKDENGVSFTCQPCPMKLKRLGSSGDLEQAMQLSIGDVGMIIAEEMLNIEKADGFTVKPVCKIRAYSSKDLNTIVFGTFVLEITDVQTTEQGSLLEVRPPNLNVSGTGQLYTVQRFPMLLGFIYGS